MKKSIFTIIAAIAMLTGAKAQETVQDKSDSDTDTRSNIILGAKLGANYSNVYDTEGQYFWLNSK